MLDYDRHRSIRSHSLPRKTDSQHSLSSLDKRHNRQPSRNSKGHPWGPTAKKQQTPTSHQQGLHSLKNSKIGCFPMRTMKRHPSRATRAHKKRIILMFSLRHLEALKAARPTQTLCPTERAGCRLSRSRIRGRFFRRPTLACINRTDEKQSRTPATESDGVVGISSPARKDDRTSAGRGSHERQAHAHLPPVRQQEFTEMHRITRRARHYSTSRLGTIYNPPPIPGISTKTNKNMNTKKQYLASIDEKNDKTNTT